MNLNKKFKRNKGITLIALVVTIIVLLILARNKYKHANRTKWNIKQSVRGKKLKWNSSKWRISEIICNGCFITRIRNNNRCKLKNSIK